MHSAFPDQPQILKRRRVWGQIIGQMRFAKDLNATHFLFMGTIGTEALITPVLDHIPPI